MVYQAIPIENLPFLYINGMIPSNNATTPNTKVDVSSGQCRDSNDIIDISLAASITIDASAAGAVNRLDTGSLAASTVYAIYVIASSEGKVVSGGLLSLASNSSPLLPLNYDSYRLIGYIATDASSNFLLMYVSGNNNYRKLVYDAPQSVGTTNASASYADIDLTKFVPVVNNTPVSIAYNFAPNADGDSFEMHGANSTGDAVTIFGPVAAKHVGSNVSVLAQTKSSKPQISYKTEAAISSLALSVAGFDFFI